MSSSYSSMSPVQSSFSSCYCQKEKSKTMEKFVLLELLTTYFWILFLIILIKVDMYSRTIVPICLPNPRDSYLINVSVILSKWIWWSQSWYWSGRILSRHLWLWCCDWAGQWGFETSNWTPDCKVCPSSFFTFTSIHYLFRLFSPLFHFHFHS